MRIMILGGWGYLGWPTALYFSARGHEVAIVDDYHKVRLEDEMNVSPLIEPPDMFTRADKWRSLSGHKIDVFVADIASAATSRIVGKWGPDTIIHYGENPSAPYSMVGPDQAVRAYRNNVEGTLRVLFAMKEHTPQAHLIKLGTMGEYGTPGIPIAEGWTTEVDGNAARLPFPKQPGSFYHSSKVADSTNIEMACRMWQIRTTDINQGVVYGTETQEIKDAGARDLATSFHYDAVFGTALNRFIAQAAIGVSPTVYGVGGQTRGFLHIEDTMQCVYLAAMNPAKPGEFRVFNQFTEVFTVEELAEHVTNITGVPYTKIPNPRVEQEEHKYPVVHEELPKLGLIPKTLTDEVLQGMFDYVLKRRNRINRKALVPGVYWR